MIDNSTTFLNMFFFGCDTYSADKIDKMVDPFVIEVCNSEKMIKTIYDDGKRLYQLLPKGREIIKR